MKDSSEFKLHLNEFCARLRTQADVMREMAKDDEDLVPPEGYVVEAAIHFVCIVNASSTPIGCPYFNISEDGVISLAWVKGEQTRLDAITFLDETDNLATVRIVLSRRLTAGDSRQNVEVLSTQSLQEGIKFAEDFASAA